jgi:hypothetical protein
MKNCVQCGEELTKEYYKCLDNFMQVKYFEADDQSDNVFCSHDCFARYMDLERIEIKED